MATLDLLASGEARTAEARRWLAEQVGAEEIAMEMHELEGYEELVKKMLAKVPPETVLNLYEPAQRLAGLPPEQRLAGLPPEQRLAGLDSDQLLLALPEVMLRALSPDYLATLPDAVRAAVRKRLGQ